MAVSGRRVYVKSKSGLYLAFGAATTGADYGPAITLDKPDVSAVWLMRWPFDYLGGTKGPTLDMKKYPSSPTTSTNFNLVHEATGAGLSWTDKKNKQLVGGRYYGDYHVNGFEDNSDRDGFNCRRDDVLVKDQGGYSYFALNNSDRSLVADLQGSKVYGWGWSGTENQFWQFIMVDGNPI